MTITINPSTNRQCTGRTSHFLVCLIRVAVVASAMYRPIATSAFLGHRHYSRKLLSRQHQNIILQSISSTTRITTEQKKHALNSSSNCHSLDLHIPTAEDMEDIGGLLSVHSTKGDVILLDGDLGAGKTCFSRGFIRGRTGSANERVTSPTYLLSNTYAVDGGDTKIYHMDLYRLSGSEDDLVPLDLDNVFNNGISLIEWPSRLSKKPSERLDIILSIDSTIQDDDDTDSISRCMKLVPFGERWEERLKFLEDEGYFEDLIMDSSTMD
ncbi:hypothetical protein ACHAXR_005844 [Thalassiosira sp. AJA248-18]